MSFSLLIVATAAFLASFLTLFSGFGLGTLLMPVFALFFPVTAAIAMTALVHFANNIFKLILLGRFADRKIVVRFGVPAVLSAFLGARLLAWLSDLPALASYEWMGGTAMVTPVKLGIGLMMIFFAFLEIIPAFSRASLDPKWVPVGGILSGFFGGLSGHQGALRSAFLIRCRLSKEAFISTGVVIACAVDIIRLSVYATEFQGLLIGEHRTWIGIACFSAFAGVWAARKFLTKMTIGFVQNCVAFFLTLIGLGLCAGWF